MEQRRLEHNKPVLSVRHGDGRRARNELRHCVCTNGLLSERNNAHRGRGVPRKAGQGKQGHAVAGALAAWCPGVPPLKSLKDQSGGGSFSHTVIPPPLRLRPPSPDDEAEEEVDDGVGGDEDGAGGSAASQKFRLTYRTTDTCQCCSPLSCPVETATIWREGRVATGGAWR